MDQPGERNSTALVVSKDRIDPSLYIAAPAKAEHHVVRQLRDRRIEPQQFVRVVEDTTLPAAEVGPE